MLHWKRASGGNCQNKENTWVIQQYKYMEMSCLHTVFCMCLSVQYFLAALCYAVIFFWHNWRPFTSFVFKLEYSKYKVSVAAGELALKVTGFCYFWMDWGEAMNSVTCFIYLFIFVLTDVMQDSKASPQATLWQFTSSCENTNSRCNPNFSVGYYPDFTSSTSQDELWIYFLKKLHIFFLWQFI